MVYSADVAAFEAGHPRVIITRAGGCERLKDFIVKRVTPEEWADGGNRIPYRHLEKVLSDESNFVFFGSIQTWDPNDLRKVYDGEEIATLFCFRRSGVGDRDATISLLWTKNPHRKKGLAKTAMHLGVRDLLDGACAISGTAPTTDSSRLYEGLGFSRAVDKSFCIEGSKLFAALERRKEKMVAKNWRIIARLSFVDENTMLRGASFREAEEVCPNCLPHNLVTMARTRKPTKPKARSKHPCSKHKQKNAEISGANSFVCEHCGKSCPSSQSRWNHKKKHHPEELEKKRKAKKAEMCSSERPFPCRHPNCTSRFTGHNHRLGHERKVHKMTRGVVLTEAKSHQPRRSAARPGAAAGGQVAANESRAFPPLPGASAAAQTEVWAAAAEAVAAPDGEDTDSEVWAAAAEAVAVAAPGGEDTDSSPHQ